MASRGRSKDSREPHGGPDENLAAVGKYRIIKRLGAGGMGTVYLAVDEKLNRTVALKVLPRERAENSTLVKRFHSEAQSAAQLEHKNIVHIYEDGEADGYLYIALEYIEGVDVHELVNKRGVLPVKRSIDIIRQVAEALDHATSKHIVHRDIKPANLLIKRDGTVKLADMGLARSIDEAMVTNITRAGMTVGTVDYMSPEQARSSKSVDVRSDIYSLGCTWYHMLTGRPPFTEGGLSEKLQAHAVGNRPDPRNENDAVPEAVVAVMHRMMARRPEDRYQSPRELLDDLDLASKSLRTFNASVMEALSEDADSSSRSRRRARSAGGPTALPPKEGEFRPVDVTSGRTFNIDIIRFAIPALLVMLVLGILVWAMRQGDDASLSGAGAAGAHQFPDEELQQQDNGNSPPTVPGSDDQTTYSPPDATTPPVEVPPPRLVVSVPFPGADDQPTTDDGVRLIPDWVDQFRADRTKPVPNIVVSRRANGAGQFRRLNEAIAALPREGGVIEVDSDGPLLLEPTEINSRGTVRILAAQGRRPVILLSSSSRKANTQEWLTVRAPQLEFENLHFVMVDPPATDITLLSVKEGDLALRNCSITYHGTEATAATAIAVSGQSAPRGRGAPPKVSSGHCLLENVVCRGDRLTAVRLAGDSAELVAGNCLIASGDAPAIVLGDAGTRGTQRSGTPARQGVRLLASTLLSSRSAVELVGTESGGKPTPSEIVVRKSLLASSGSAENFYTLALVTLTGITDNVSDTHSPRETVIDWTMDNSLYLGWPALVRMVSSDGIESRRIETTDEWQTFWDRPLETHAVVDMTAPPAGWEQPASVTPQDVSPEMLASLIGASNGIQAGCRADKFDEIPLGMIEHATIASRVPDDPEGLGARMPPDEKPYIFDMMGRRSLETFLESSVCKDGDHIVATGSGLRKLGPVEIVGKSIRLEFKTVGGNPLVIQTTPASGSTRPQATITVRNGSLDLVGARIKVPATKSESQSPWLLQLAGGSVSLRGCTLEGPSTPSAGHSGLIQIADAESNEPATACCVLIEDSFLTSPAHILSGPIRWDRLILRNSVFATQGDLLSLQFDEPGLRRQPTAVISHCTFAAGHAVFRFAGDVPPAEELPLLDLIVTACVFAGPVEGGGSPAAVVSRDTASQTEHAVRWWGNANGFAPTLPRLMLTGNESQTSASFDSEWTTAWGPGHIAHPLYGPTEVIFANAFPAWSKLIADSFLLSKTSPAATWASDGSAIGADLGHVGADHVHDSSSAKDPSPAATGKTPPRSPRRNPF